MTDERPERTYHPDDDDWAQTLRDTGRLWCRPCGDWHRPPECWIDSDGVSALDVREQCRDAGHPAGPDADGRCRRCGYYLPESDLPAPQP